MMEVLENVPGRKGGTSFGGYLWLLSLVRVYMLVATPASQGARHHQDYETCMGNLISINLHLAVSEWGLIQGICIHKTPCIGFDGHPLPQQATNGS